MAYESVTGSTLGRFADSEQEILRQSSDGMKFTRNNIHSSLVDEATWIEAKELVKLRDKMFKNTTITSLLRAGAPFNDLLDTIAAMDFSSISGDDS